MALAFFGSDMPIPIILPGIGTMHQLYPRAPLYPLYSILVYGRVLLDRQGWKLSRSANIPRNIVWNPLNIGMNTLSEHRFWPYLLIIQPQRHLSSHPCRMCPRPPPCLQFLHSSRSTSISFLKYPPCGRPGSFCGALKLLRSFGHTFL